MFIIIVVRKKKGKNNRRKSGEIEADGIYIFNQEIQEKEQV